MKKIPILILLLATFLNSCQKETDQSDMQDPVAYTVRLKSVIYFDTTKVAGQDTVYKNEYWYDGDGRLIRKYDAEYSYTPTVQIITFTHDFSYNGPDKTPFKVVSSQTSVTTPFHLFMTYNDSNAVLKDSSFLLFSPNIVSLKTYTNLSPGRYLRLYKEKDLATGIVTHRDSVIYRRTITNGNIVSGVDSSHKPTLGLRTVNMVYTYDDKANPFASIGVWRILGDYQFSGDGVLPRGKNNATSFSETYFDGVNTSTYSGTVVYTYRPDGLPLTARISSYPDANKVLFTYY